METRERSFEVEVSHCESFSLGKEGQIIGIMTYTVPVGLQIYHGTLLASLCCAPC